MLAAGRCGATIADEMFEARGIDVSIDRRAYPDVSRTTARAEHPTKLRHLRLQRVGGFGRLVLAPAFVDEPIVRHRTGRRQREQRKERLELGAGDRHRAAGAHLDRAEDRHAMDISGCTGHWRMLPPNPQVRAWLS